MRGERRPPHSTQSARGPSASKRTTWAGPGASSVIAWSSAKKPSVTGGSTGGFQPSVSSRADGVTSRVPGSAPAVIVSTANGERYTPA